MPALNQFKYHAYVHRMFQPVLEHHEEKMITLEAYSLLAPIFRFLPGPYDEVLENVAKKVSESSGGASGNPGQVCLICICAFVSALLRSSSLKTCTLNNTDGGFAELDGIPVSTSGRPGQNGRAAPQPRNFAAVT